MGAEGRLRGVHSLRCVPQDRHVGQGADPARPATAQGVLESVRGRAMKRSNLFAIVALCVAALAPALRAADAPTSQPAQTDWFAMSADEFARADAANQPLRFDRIDPTLLSAAILHETNRRRAENHLPPLSHNAKLDEAAETHVKD